MNRKDENVNRWIETRVKNQKFVIGVMILLEHRYRMVLEDFLFHIKIMGMGKPVHWCSRLGEVTIK